MPIPPPRSAPTSNPVPPTPNAATPLRTVSAFGRSVVALRAGPLPRSAMLRSGCAVGLGFLITIAFGSREAAVVCAAFTNFLCLSDRASALRTRIWVQLLGAVLSTAAGAVGLLLTGDEPLILVTLFTFALGAGFVHGTAPGVEAIPRYAIVCFVVSAYLPVGQTATVVAILLATALATTTVLIDHRIRNGRRGLLNARIRAAVIYPAPLFSLVYGVATMVGLGIGLVWGQARPYWVTVTTLLVMQPDRRANAVRVVQRFFGTIGGVVLAFLMVQAAPIVSRHESLLLLVVVLPFVWPLGYERNYGLGTAILSAWILLLIDTALPSEHLVMPLFLARLSDTAIGCAVALAGGFVVLEARDGATRP